MPKREIPSIQNLMVVARELGYSSAEEARRILKVNGVKGKFDPTKFDEYVAILTTHAKSLTSILNKLNQPNSQEKGEATSTGTGKSDLPAHAERVLRARGQQPWLLKPVAYDGRTYRFIEDREELKKNEVLAYEGVTKTEHLNAIEEMGKLKKEKENAVGSG